MKYHETKEVKIAAYPHKLNQSLAAAFVWMVEWYFRTKTACNVMTDIGLTHNQKANFQKLKHFGIVQNIKDGEWMPTPLGLDFYQGKIAILDTAASLDNETLPYSHPCWKTHARELQAVYIHDLYNLDRRYATREEYREHVRGTLFDNVI